VIATEGTLSVFPWILLSPRLVKGLDIDATESNVITHTKNKMTKLRGDTAIVVCELNVFIVDGCLSVSELLLFFLLYFYMRVCKISLLSFYFTVLIKRLFLWFWVNLGYSIPFYSRVITVSVRIMTLNCYLFMRTFIFSTFSQ